MWELLWLSGFILMPMFFLLPETSTPTLLYHKVRRLRTNGLLEATTADTHSSTKRLTRADVVKLALIKPFEITMKDPAIAFVNIYVRLHLSNSLLLDYPNTDHSLDRPRSLTGSTTHSSKSFHSSTPRSTA